MRMRDDWQLLVRLIDHGFHFLHRHFVLVDQLDDVDPGIREFLSSLARP